jgi:hypothetical protein
MKQLKSITTIVCLFLAFAASAQKVKLKKGEVLVDDVVWMKYDGCGMFQANCSAYNLKGDELIFIKMIDHPFDETMYCEVKFLGMNLMAEFEHTSIKSIFEKLYKGKVVTPEGELDEDKAALFVEKYGTPISKRLNRNTTNTVIIREDDDDDAPKVNISIGR